MSEQRSSPSERGAASVEFAVSAIVLVTLVFGCIGVCMAFYTYEVVNQYARDASRYAMVHGNGCQMQTTGNVGNSCNIGAGDTAGPPPTTGPADAQLSGYLNNELFPGIDGTKLQVHAIYALGPGEASCTAPNCNGAGDQVTVNVSYPYLYAVPFIPSNSFTMNASSTMVISQ